MKGSFLHFNFRPLRSSLMYEQINTNTIKKMFSGRHSEFVVSYSLLLPSALLLSFFPRPQNELLFSFRVVHYHVLYGHHISKRKNQLGKIVNLAPSRSAEQGKCFFSCPRLRLKIWSRETGSAIPSRVSLLISILRLKLVLT